MEDYIGTSTPPLPLPPILCYTHRMKRLLSVLYLTIAVFLGSAGMSWGADFQKGFDAAQRGDYATALREFRPFAEQGNARAQYNLGVMYANGQGVSKNNKTALKWYRLAAEQGVTRAQTNLGFMYGNGHGVPQDNVLAHMWYNIAASSGDKVASKNRDIVAKRMNSNQIITAQKLARKCVRKKYKGC